MKDNSNNNAKLTIAEQKVLDLVAKEKSNKRISEELFISERTVEVHRRNIIKKLNLPGGNNALSKWAIKGNENN